MKLSRQDVTNGAIFTVSLAFTLSFVVSQVVGQGPPPARYHTAIQSTGAEPVRSTERLSLTNRVSIRLQGNERVIRSNGIPAHPVGRFPNRGNPHSISEQSHEFEVPAKPDYRGRATDVEMSSFGVAVNGVPFDPSAAEWYKGSRHSDWRYEALSGAVPLGVDENFAHVQPGGLYHYHGLPWGLLDRLKASAQRHSPLVGWAADGFPIYAVHGYANGKDRSAGIKAYKSSYRLKKGPRPDSWGAPGGRYDGTFIPDYEFVEGAGDLDKCNGARVSTPDFPGGTYAYFLSESWPVIPRCYNGSPDSSFAKRRGGGPGGPGGPPPGGGFGRPGGPPPGGGFRPPPRRRF